MKMKIFVNIYFAASLVGGFAPSIDLPTTTTEPTTTTPDPATLPFIVGSEAKENITALNGSAVLLACQVLRLGDYMVSWLKRVDDRLDLLTIGLSTYHSDSRYKLVYISPNNWSLQIQPVVEMDKGAYECLISTHPPMTKTIYLKVKTPRIEIRESTAKVIHEKFYEVGSSIDLQCVGFDIPRNTSLVWLKGNTSLTHLTRGHDNTSSEGSSNIRSDSFTNELDSRVGLRIGTASPNDTGNYSCQASQFASASVKLHVLDGEDSVAMQHSTNSVLFVKPFNFFLLIFGLTSILFVYV